MGIKQKCQCCGNHVYATANITMYWLQGRNYVWSVCYECWAKPSLLALFLNTKGDLPDELIKKHGKYLGYTKEEIKVLQ